MWRKVADMYILWEFDFLFLKSGVNSSWSWVLYYQKYKSYGAVKWHLWKPDLVALYADSKIAFRFPNPQSKEQWMSAVQIIIQHGVSPSDFHSHSLSFLVQGLCEIQCVCTFNDYCTMWRDKTNLLLPTGEHYTEETSKVTPTYPQQSQTSAGSLNSWGILPCALPI